jgi:Zn-dependent M28 family amino/carboxypeptidase
VIVIGAGASQLEDTLKAVLDGKGRVIRPDPTPENGFFYRSDHISLAKKGVPMLYVRTGIDLIDGGIEAGQGFAQRYTTDLYHKPADEYADTWTLDGMAEDVNIDFDVINVLANNTEWPNWYDGNEFRAMRDAQRAQ